MDETTHGPSARSDRLSVRLVGAEETTLSVGGLLDEGDPETRRTTLLFFDVLNRSDGRVSWWFDDHKFVDADGYLYPTLDEYDLDESGLPPGWYTSVELEPETRCRCVTAVDTMPERARLERVIYRGDAGTGFSFGEEPAPDDGERYELDLSGTDLSSLGSPPFGT